jgi:hypothetical protein
MKNPECANVQFDNAAPEEAEGEGASGRDFFVLFRTLKKQYSNLRGDNPPHNWDALVSD